MSHERSRDELVDLALGLLDPDAARALEAHAGTCATCRAELDALRQTRRLLAGLPPAEAPSRGEAPLLAAAREEAARAEAARRPRWATPAWLWGGTLGLAGAAALAVLVLRFSGPPPRGPLGDDAEALLGRGVPAPAAPAAPPAKALATAAPAARDEARETAASSSVVKASEAPRPRAEPLPAQARPAEPAREAGPPGVPAAATPVALAERKARSEESIGVGEARGDTQDLLAPAAPASPPLAKASRLQAATETRAAPSSALAPAGAAADAGGAPCRLEARRRLTRDAAGQVTGRVRDGRYPADGGEVPLTVEERFGPDGRLLGAEVRAGERRLVVSGADVEAGRLEPLPGVWLARTAAEAERAPPRCEP